MDKEVKVFYTCYNNGVTAIVDEATFASIQKYNDIWQLFAALEANDNTPIRNRWQAEVARTAMKHLTVPIFTFVRSERFNGQPWFTGDIELVNALIEELIGRGDIVGNQGFYVPFSNGCEVGMHGRTSMEDELAYVTSERQFKEVFGFTIGFLVSKYGLQAEG